MALFSSLTPHPADPPSSPRTTFPRMLWFRFQFRAWDPQGSCTGNSQAQPIKVQAAPLGITTFRQGSGREQWWSPRFLLALLPLGPLECCCALNTPLKSHSGVCCPIPWIPCSRLDCRGQSPRGVLPYLLTPAPAQPESSFRVTSEGLGGPGQVLAWLGGLCLGPP